jgi:hypothetical protein
MRTGAGTFIGRASELAILTEFIDTQKSGLVLVLGKRRVGKRQLLLALRDQLVDRHQLVPQTDPEDRAALPFLAITESTQVADIKAQLVDQAAGGHDEDVAGSRVILCYGYQPSAAMARWLRSGLLRSLGSTQRAIDPPSSPSGRSAAAGPGVGQRATIVVLAALESDVRGVIDLASLVVPLEPLSRDAVREHFLALGDELAEPLGEAELETYVELVRGDAGLLPCLESVLMLDRPDQVPA